MRNSRSTKDSSGELKLWQISLLATLALLIMALFFGGMLLANWLGYFAIEGSVTSVKVIASITAAGSVLGIIATYKTAQNGY